jgi:hypothetical protein
MTIEEALDRSLDEIRFGNASVEDCLAEYPQFADRLRPLLKTSLRLEKTHQVRPSREFRNQLRRQLAQPTKRRRFLSFFSISLTLVILLVLLLLIWVGTSFVHGNYLLNQVLPNLPLLQPVSHLSLLEMNHFAVSFD